MATATRTSTLKRSSRAIRTLSKRRASSTRMKASLPVKKTVQTTEASSLDRPPTTKPKSAPKRKQLDYESLTKTAHAGDAKDIAAVRPPPAPPPPPLDPNLVARNIREVGPAAALYAAVGNFYGSRIDLGAFKVLMDDMLRDLDAKDPVQRMLAEQIVLAHHVGGKLQAKAANQEKAKNAEVYLRGAAKLMSELRKHIELFTRLRSQSAASQTSTRSEPGGEPEKNGNSKLASKTRKRGTRAA
jgi:hypothetical protein